MINKEFVLVSQGIEIYRTKSQEQAIDMVKEYNDEYFDYKQKCFDNYERPADNYVYLEIEYSNEKEKDKEIERLNTDKEQLTSLVNSCQEEIRKLKSQLQQKENKEKELKEYIEENLCYSTCDGMKYTMPSGKNILEILDKVGDEK